jgi:transcriptional regulator with XRE-family HTH domain
MLGSFLRTLRTQRGLAQAVVAQRLGCSDSTVGHVENGVRHPTARRLAMHLDALQATNAERLTAFRLAAGEEVEPDDPELQGALARLEEGDDDIDVDGAADATHRPADASDDEVRFVPDASDFADDGESCTPIHALLSKSGLDEVPANEAQPRRRRAAGA